MRTYKNATEAFLDELQAALLEGRPITVRGSEVLELRSRLIRIASPLERVLVVPHRNNNIFATLAETIWVIGGRNDLAYLSHYLPRAADFSDDGKVWRAGYGPRLRDWHGTDQVKEVVRLLNDDLHSRRAVMVIFDPAQDYVLSKDIPCNNWLHFLIRDNQLHLNVTVRSNDIVWGFSGINTFEWSVLQEMMAFWSGTQVGDVSYFVSSFHVYARHYKRAHQMVEDRKRATIYDFGFVGPRFSTPLTLLDERLAEWFAIEQRMRRGDTSCADQIAGVSDDFLRNSLEMLYVYNRSLGGADTAEVARLVRALPPNDLKMAAIEYFARTFEDRAFVELTDREKEYFDYLWAAERPAEASSVESVFALLSTLHAKKTLVYQDSWKKHGEVLGVFANITRKYDRIETLIARGGQPTADESLLDTVADLAVYSTKYLTYLADHYTDLFMDFAAQYPPVEPLAAYQHNEGFDAVSKVLIRRFHTSPALAELTSLEACFALITAQYKALEDVLTRGDWRRSDMTKCLAAADLAIGAVQYLGLASRIEPTEYQKLVAFIETL